MATDKRVPNSRFVDAFPALKRLGPLMAGFLKILPVFFLVLPGVIAYVLRVNFNHGSR